MIYHILNGDALACSFPDAKIDGEIIVVREALTEGDLSGNNLNDFWQARATYHGIPEEQYQSSTAREFEKILNAPANSDFNLWFEFDLFCQVNMWFIISIIKELPLDKKVYGVYTSHLDPGSKLFWNGFGPATSSDLATCFSNRILFSEPDLQLGQDLWAAYKNNKLEVLTLLATNHAPPFPYLEEVVKAHVKRFPGNGAKGRPEKVLEDIIKNVSPDFNTVCREFWNREAIYGFGDTQVKRLYDQVMLSS